MRDGAYDSKASHQLISRKGATACIPPPLARTLGYGKKDIQEMRLCW